MVQKRGPKVVKTPILGQKWGQNRGPEMDPYFVHVYKESLSNVSKRGSEKGQKVIKIWVKTPILGRKWGQNRGQNRGPNPDPLFWSVYQLETLHCIQKWSKNGSKKGSNKGSK